MRPAQGSHAFLHSSQPLDLAAKKPLKFMKGELIEPYGAGFMRKH
jgi:hypothetical protein